MQLKVCWFFFEQIGCRSMASVLQTNYSEFQSLFEHSIIYESFDGMTLWQTMSGCSSFPCYRFGYAIGNFSMAPITCQIRQSNWHFATGSEHEHVFFPDEILRGKIFFFWFRCCHNTKYVNRFRGGERMTLGNTHGIACLLPFVSLQHLRTCLWRVFFSWFSLVFLTLFCHCSARFPSLQCV